MEGTNDANLKYVLAVADVLLYGPDEILPKRDTEEDNHDRKQLTTTMVDVQLYKEQARDWEAKYRKVKQHARDMATDNMDLYAGMQRLEQQVTTLQKEWDLDQERIGEMAKSCSKLADDNRLMAKELREALDEIEFMKCNFESSNRVLREDHKREREEWEAEKLVLEERVALGAKRLHATKKLVYTYEGCQHTCDECMVDHDDMDSDI